MIAKLITHGRNRDQAGYRLQEIVQQVQVWPVKTNAAFLGKCLLDVDVTNGELDTGLIERKADELTAPPIADDVEKRSGMLGQLIDRYQDRMLEPLLTPSGSPDWTISNTSRINSVFGFRLNSKPQRLLRFEVDGKPETVELIEPVLGNRTLKYRGWGKGWSRLEEGFIHRYSFNLRTDGSANHSASSGTILSPMPGRIIAVEVALGQTVTKGQKLLTLEAMKMEHSLTAPFDGVVAELNAETGAQVQVEALLVRIEADGD
jgi:3-methylcrotonyl-CoA carboxylase alpha subunit